MGTKMSATLPPASRVREEEAIYWEINIPLINNRYMLRDLAIVLGLSYLILLIIFTTVLSLVGDLDELPQFLPWLGLVGLFLIVLFFFTMGILMRNRVRTAFLVNAKGIDTTTVDRWINALLKVSVIAGATGKNPTVAGSGLLAISRQRVAFPWNRIDRIEIDQKRRVIQLKDNWHVIQRVYGPEDRWDDILKCIGHYFHGPILYK